MDEICSNQSCLDLLMLWFFYFNPGAVQKRGYVDLHERAREESSTPCCYGTTLPTDPTCALPCSWTTTDPSTFLIRGKTYLSDQKKVKNSKLTSDVLALHISICIQWSKHSLMVDPGHGTGYTDADGGCRLAKVWQAGGWFGLPSWWHSSGSTYYWTSSDRFPSLSYKFWLEAYKFIICRNMQQKVDQSSFSSWIYR